ncbi:flagellar basal body rod protein FlgB [Roseburia sp. AM51-8]|jgi:flagellar basal-body rod protein FlgB|uniref:flagellar basal body rod protein FlgB n=1 Tax=unclassified Roseburia TaxID=2637578 RepID=UPI000E4AF1C9|nr:MULTISPECIES: flagellar basal body rod protein FlgB [unclassified Roseburia]MDY3873457.1 flagellar basal body rod protein FlgB [Roseburia lenta]RHO32037.1 flagellar basal body rod protein FlgB [Roseburia sp. AM16-25]RHQ02358.1 flagellar basal body rod protein FlgB [Roseburia sp. AM51-8]
MINSNAFSYINVLDRAADASWTRETVIGNNIANVDTPGYKRQDVAFEDVLKRELKSSKYDTLQKAVDNVSLNKLEGRTYTDYASYSYRLDGNNVDIDTENVELASEQLRYQTLTSAVSNEFTRMNTAMQTP